MESIPINSPLVVILGQTASGKSALAMKLAKRFNGEIIAADSRTVYKGMDIGTAKPTKEDQACVPHHLLNVVAPDQPFSAADFQRRALTAIADITLRGKLPILVGGSGLYIDAVIYNFSFRPQVGLKQRQKIRALSVDELQLLLQERGIDFPKNYRNPRHLVSSLEGGGLQPGRESLRPSTVVIGLELPKDQLESRIVKRVDEMVKDGLVLEVAQLVAQYGWDTPALLAPGYRAFRLYLSKTISLDEAKRLFVQLDMQYAKRQKTWFKRNTDIQWISKTAEAVDLVTTLVNN